MNISKVSVELTGSDILSGINDFIKIDGVELKNVHIDKGIFVEGTLKKGVSIDFEGELQIIGVHEGKLIGRFSKCKVLKIGFFRMIRSFALKMLLKDLKDIGVENERDNVILNPKKLLKDIPFVDINLKDAYVKGQALHLEIENISLSIKGELIKENEEEILEGEILEEKPLIIPSDKVKDNYTLGRNYVETKLPENLKEYSDYIMILPDVVALIYRLLKDKRVKMSTKLIISAAVGYVVFPTDIIPNNIPFIGRIDDIAVVFFALNRIVSDVDTQIILENYAGKDELLLLLKNGVEFLTTFTGAKNVDKLYKVIEEVSTL